MEPASDDDCCTSGGALSDPILLMACMQDESEVTTGFTWDGAICTR